VKGGIFLDITANVCVSLASAIRTKTSWIGMEPREDITDIAFKFWLSGLKLTPKEENEYWFFIE